MGKAQRKSTRSGRTNHPAKLSRLGSLRIYNEKAMAQLARSDRGSPDYKAAMAQIEKNSRDELDLRLAKLNEMFEAEPA